MNRQALPAHYRIFELEPRRKGRPGSHYRQGGAVTPKSRGGRTSESGLGVRLLDFCLLDAVTQSGEDCE